MRLRELDYCIVDVETTGFSPKKDRIVEVAAVRWRPGQPEQTVLDTLVHPETYVSCTWIHKIGDADVADAPTFSKALSALRAAMGGCVVVAHNTSFDVKFLEEEAKRLGAAMQVPHLCTMWMSPLLEIGPKEALEKACERHGIHCGSPHVAREDALATLRLLQHQLKVCEGLGIETTSDLAKRGKYKFLKSLSRPPTAHPPAGSYDFLPKTRSPEQHAPCPEGTQAPSPADLLNFRRYQDAVQAVVAGAAVTQSEADALRDLRHGLGIYDAVLRATHARIYATALLEFTDDLEVDDEESLELQSLWRCLADLGWAPGE